MTHECENCHKCFKYKYLLVRHLGRKSTCVDGTKTNVWGTKMNVENILKQQEIQNESDFKECMYCFKEFVNKKGYTRHISTCKYKDDETRKLELELNIDPFISNKLQCRFCKNYYTTTYRMSTHYRACKEKRDYHEKLVHLKNKYTSQNFAEGLNVTNNITNNNITNNNIIINAIGNESVEHITTQMVLEILLRNRIKYCSDSLYLKSGHTVIDFHKLLQENEANRNIVVSNMRSQTASVMTDNGVEEQDIDQVLKQCFINSSKKLVAFINNEKHTDLRDELLVVDHMRRVGYTAGTATENNLLKRQFKVVNLRNKKQLCNFLQ